MTAERSNQSGSLLARLVGPAGPEVSCELCFTQLDGFVEAELADADAARVFPGMREHFEGCAACAEDRDSLRALVLDTR